MPGSTRSPTLNLDILREIVLCTCPETAASLMYVCHFFYHEAAKSVLRQKAAHVVREVDTAKLLRFLLAEGTTRLPYVRELCLDFSLSCLSTTTSSRFATLIPLMTGLDTLSIKQSEIAFTQHLGIYDAIVNLTSLRNLRIAAAGRRTCDLLRGLQSLRLTSIEIDWHNRERGGFFVTEVPSQLDWLSYHPVLLLERWSSSLQELKCTDWYTGHNAPTFTYVYPRLRRLSIQHYYCPLVAPYIQAFPNLTHLRICADCNGDIMGRGSGIMGYRDDNIRSQVAQNGRCTWRSLEVLTGWIVDMYMFGLTCHVSRLDCWTFFEQQSHFHRLSAVLSLAKPLSLKVRGSINFLRNPAINLPTILQEPGASSLETLEIKIVLEKESFEVDVPICMAMLASALKRLPLRHLNIEVRTFGLNPTPVGAHEVMGATLGWMNQPMSPSPTPLSLTTTEKSYEGFDVSAFARGLAGEIPTLTHGVIRVEAIRSSSEVWEAVFPGGTTQLRRKNPDVTHEM